MNKREFLDALRQGIAALPESERTRIIDYYGEMIDDRIEEGVCEAEAVAAMGDPRALARELSPAGTRPARDEGTPTTVDSLLNLNVRVHAADVVLKREPLDNGAAAQLRFSDPERFTWRVEDGSLEISEVETAKERNLKINLFGLELPFGRSGGDTLTITLADTLPGDFRFVSEAGDLSAQGLQTAASISAQSAGGDVRLSGCRSGADVAVETRSGDAELSEVRAGGRMAVHSTNGDIQLRDCRGEGELSAVSASGDVALSGASAGGGMTVKSKSGDIEGTALAANDQMSLESISGDITLREGRAAGLSARSTSGDVELERVVSGSARVASVSGDVRLEELESDPRLDVETSSGDMELNRCIARETWLTSASGDIRLRLHELSGGYDLSADTRSGSIRLPKEPANAPEGTMRPVIRARTASGDIEAGMI